MADRRCAQVIAPCGWVLFMSQVASGLGVQSYQHFGLGSGRLSFRTAAPFLNETLTTSTKLLTDGGELDRSLPRPAEKAAARVRRTSSCSLRPMKVGDIVRAMKIAADNFRGEVDLVARSYLWHFARRVGLGGVSAMWTRRVVKVSAKGERPVSFDLFSSFVHDRDVAWI